LALTAVVLSAKNMNRDNEVFVHPAFTSLHEVHSFETYTYEEHPFQNYTRGQIKKLLGLRKMKAANDNLHFPRGNVSNDLPVSFDSRQAWPECIHEIRDQGQCGSCWAHAASEVLSDRFCIASNGTVNVVLSPQEMVSCDYMDMGCNGGILTTSWLYLRIFGIATDKCQPYKSGTGDVPSCSWTSSCEDGSEYKKYKASTWYSFSTVNDIKQNIMTNGPVETGFSVYEDFMNYKSGIYKRESANMLGGHAVKVVGWGKEADTEYWIVANSWSPTWGENGFFRIAFGECGMEGGMIAGEPSL